MKGKMFFVIIFTLLLTGCSATYDLYISEHMTDNLYLYEDNNILKNLDYYDMEADTELNLNSYSNSIVLFERDFNYKREEYSSNIFSGYIYNYAYKYNDMKNKSMVYDCYDEVKVNRKDNIVIETSNVFKCFDEYPLLDDVVVNIHYSGKLVSTNADKEDDGIYTWYIDKNNYNNKKIYLELKMNKENNTLDIIGGFVFGILLLVAVIIVWRYKKMNY